MNTPAELGTYKAFDDINNGKVAKGLFNLAFTGASIALPPPYGMLLGIVGTVGDYLLFPDEK
jgi:hypothetical protein